jgi:hypothetical protein
MNNFPIALILLLVIILVSKLFNDRALKILNIEQKAQLIDLFQKRRTYQIIVILVITTLYFCLLNYFPAYYLQEITLFIAIILFFILVDTYLTVQVLKTNHFPSEYIVNYKLGAIIRLVGIIAYFVLVTYELYVN